MSALAIYHQLKRAGEEPQRIVVSQNPVFRALRLHNLVAAGACFRLVGKPPGTLLDERVLPSSYPE